MSSSSINSIGIMTGTSLDGVDVALLKTDGKQNIKYITSRFSPFPGSLRQKLHFLIESEFSITQYCYIEKEYTEFCYDVVAPIIKEHEVDLIGFHGQTLFHAPQDYITHQMGSAQYLQKLSKVKVIADFRTADIMAGGQGAPLVPIFHRAMLAKESKPFAVLNIGGVSNITYIDENQMIAFDTGPGSAPLNDVMQKYYQKSYDEGGNIAAKGAANHAALDLLLADPFFADPLPKSLDRNHFDYKFLNTLAPHDQLATICEFIVKSINLGLDQLPQVPNVIYICGGGRHNNHIINLLKKSANIKLIDELGIDGDMVEAYAFAYLAVRKSYGLYCGTNSKLF